MKRRSNLDEMQEQELLKIEHNGCWLAFWLLLIAMVVQCFAFGSMDFRVLGGEWTVFMILSVYLAIACVRKGIWDRRIPMDTKSNVIASLIAGAAIGVFNMALILKKYPKPLGAAAAGIFIGSITFVICFAVLTVLMKQTQKKQAEMEAEPSEANEM